MSDIVNTMFPSQAINVNTMFPSQAIKTNKTKYYI